LEEDDMKNIRAMLR
jgi:hypothetical protein